jgi:adenine phosphoribosyltransferase
MIDLKTKIRSVPDFPKKGIIFKDITTILKDPQSLRYTLVQLLSMTDKIKIDKVAGIEARGFMFGCMLAEKLNAGFVPVRKPGKLPADTIKETYSLEYGTDTIEMHKDAISAGDKVLLHDDLLATGGTACAAARLIEKAGGEIVLVSFIVELCFLNGREKLNGYNIRSVVQFDGE